MLASIVVTPLRRIATPGGQVLHGLKATDPGFCGFGEAYFSAVDRGAVKGWKRHHRMTLNFIVPIGLVQVAATNGRNAAVNYLLGPGSAERYVRLTIPPGWWIAFGGLSEKNMILNIADITHDPEEAESATIDRFPWIWRNL